MDSVIDLCSSSDEDEASLSDVSLVTQQGQGDAYGSDDASSATSCPDDSDSDYAPSTASNEAQPSSSSHRSNGRKGETSTRKTSNATIAMKVAAAPKKCSPDTSSNHKKNERNRALSPASDRSESEESTPGPTTLQRKAANNTLRSIRSDLSDSDSSWDNHFSPTKAAAKSRPVVGDDMSASDSSSDSSWDTHFSPAKGVAKSKPSKPSSAKEHDSDSIVGLPIRKSPSKPKSPHNKEARKQSKTTPSKNVESYASDDDWPRHLTISHTSLCPRGQQDVCAPLHINDEDNSVTRAQQWRDQTNVDSDSLSFTSADEDRVNDSRRGKGTSVAGTSKTSDDFPLRYRSNEDDLALVDQNFLEQYRSFQNALRKQKISPFDAPSMTEHRQNIQHKGIAIATENEYVKELLRYHGWACIKQGRPAHQVLLTSMIVSYASLFSYCKFLEEERGTKLWSTNKICQSVLSVLYFRAAKIDCSRAPEVETMLAETKQLYASISRAAVVERNERPSLCERRERGEALSFLDITAVCNAQFWRVRALVAFRKKTSRNKALNSAVKRMLSKEVLRLAVLLTLLKYPTRKIEAKRSVIERTGQMWRLKISASDRKRGKFPIDVKLSSTEAQIFNLLRNLEATDTDNGSSWKPFEGHQVTEILKATTKDMTRVGVTVTALRSAAESHVDILGYNCNQQTENIQRALSHAEGHSEDMAKLFYKRNGSQSIMKAWTAYVDSLMNIESSEPDEDAVSASIMRKINTSQKQWIKEIQSTIQKSATAPDDNALVPKKRADWSSKEDKELRKRVRICGEGRWKDILESSPILQERYKGVSPKKAREGLKDRWRTSRKRKRGTSRSHRNYPRHEWTVHEDHALEMAVNYHVEINPGREISWKAIHEESKLFREMYEHLPKENARSCLRDRWRALVAKDSAEGKIAVKMHSSSKHGQKKRQRTSSSSKLVSEVLEGVD